MKGQKYQQQAAIRVTSRIRASLLARAFTRQVQIGSLGMWSSSRASSSCAAPSGKGWCRDDAPRLVMTTCICCEIRLSAVAGGTHRRDARAHRVRQRVKDVATDVHFEDARLSALVQA
jgi:hypothetical protein